MTTQIEQIEWHKYPEEKPSKVDWYLVDEHDGVNVVFWGDNSWYFERWETIKAWAVLPKGWRE